MDLRPLILICLLCPSLNVLATETCSRAVRIGAGITDTQQADSEAHWLLRFLQEYDCAYQWLAHEQSSERNLHMLEHGEIDVLLDASRSAERERYAYFSAPYRREQFLLFTRKNYPLQTDLAGYWQQQAVLSVPKFGVYPPAIKQWYERFDGRAQLTQYKNVEQALALLKHGRSDILLLSDSFFMRHPEQFVEMQKLGLQLAGDEVHLMFSRRSMTSADVELFNRWSRAHPFGKP